jgi:broad specificity phosphatase PhoE
VKIHTLSLMFLVLHIALAASSDTTTLRHRYYALRHGQSLANVAHIISSDPAIATVEHGLSETGWEQAREAADAVCDEARAHGLDVAIISSDFKRAWQTAQSVRAGCLAAGVPVWPPGDVWPTLALRERSFGELSGGSDDRYEDVWVKDARSAEHVEYGVESIRSVLARARGVVQHLEASSVLDPNRRWMVVLVAHGDVLQILQTAFARVDVTRHRSLEHLPTATLRALGPVWGTAARQDGLGEQTSERWSERV